MSRLISALIDGARGGTIPRPAPGEPIDEYRIRCAHAGAVIAMSLAAQAAAAADMAKDDTPLAPPPATPLEEG